jgi:hypothetical protein
MNFEFGSNIANLIGQTAQENLLKTGDVKAQLKFIKESIGCDDEQATNLLIGTAFVLEQEEDDKFYYRERHTGATYPQLNVNYILNEIQINVARKIAYYDSLIFSTNFKHSMIFDDSSIELKLSFNDVVDFLNPKTREKAIDQFEWKLRNDTFTKAAYNAQTVVEIMTFADDINKQLDAVKWIMDNTEKLDVYISDVDIQMVRDDLTKLIRDTNYAVSCFINKYKGSDALQSYLDAQEKIDKELNTFTPLMLDERRKAVWIDPNGVMWGLDGEVSNLLHITMANKLKEIHAIYYREGDFSTPEEYMEFNGWAKLQNNTLQFVVAVGGKLNKLTEKQLRSLKNYLTVHYNGVIKVGIDEKAMPVAQFCNMDSVMQNKMIDGMD